MMRRYRFVNLLPFVLGMAWSMHAAAAAAPARAAYPPVEAFFANKAFGEAILSPDGRRLAVRVGASGRRDFLAVIDLATKTAKNVAEYSVADIGEFRWVNNARLVYNLYDRSAPVEGQDDPPGLFAVDADGSGRRQLVSRDPDHAGSKLSYNTALIAQAGRQDSSSVYVEKFTYDYKRDYAGSVFWLLDTVTGALDSPAGIKASDLVLDFQGKPRLAILHSSTQTTFAYRDPAKNAWRELARFDRYGDIRTHIVPLGFGPDGTLYVKAYAGHDLITLRTMDLATGEVSKDALVETPGYDFDGSLVADHAKLLGVRIKTDAEANIWFDPAMQAIQKAVDKALPGTVNLLTVPAEPGAPWLLVESYSDRQPSTYALYDRASGAVEAVGAAYPQIARADMGRQKVIGFKARDGLPIPGLLTLPPGNQQKDLPMVVLVHGGPYVRGASWGWDDQAQFLATRGYAVLQIEFRGSTGFGAAHASAGFKQWGLAMQNDIADGTRWAIAQGIADPARICIGGASYGGYATLMGLINDPDLYRCGFEWAGVTDIDLLLTGTWFDKSSLSEGYVQYGAPQLIGDVARDAAQFQATSPIRQAARITRPLLLAYGRSDQRVPIIHGRRLWSVVGRTNKDVEWVEYQGEGHGWSRQENRIDFWRRVERFLQRNIGRRAPPAGRAGPDAAAAPGGAQASF